MLDRPVEREPTVRNWPFQFTPRESDPEPITLKNKAAQQPIEPTSPKRDPAERENEASDVADLQESVIRSFVTAFFAVGLRLLKRQPNPSLDPAVADLRALRDEEAREDVPITPFAFATALVVLSAAFNEIDAPVPMPAIAPDGAGGLRIEWARRDRNVRAVVPARANQRSFVYHIVDGVSKLDRLSGANLAARLREVIL